MRRILVAVFLATLSASPLRAADADALLDAADLLTEMIEALPQEWVGIEGLVRETGGEAEAMIGWVTENIAYRPYAGTMRGPDGTLATGAGNALDQALLLGAALNAAGFEARIVETTLGEAGVDALLARALAQPLQVEKVGPDIRARLDSLVEDMAEVLGIDTPAEPEAPDLDALRAEARAGTERVLATLTDAGRQIDTAPAMATLRAAIAPYHHVRWRLQASDPWQEAHPALGRAPDGASEPGRILVGTLPDDLLHKVEVTARIRVESPTGARDVTVGTAQITVANALTFTPVYQAFAVGIESAEDYLAGDVARITRFMPTFAGQEMGGAQLFNLNGVVVDPVTLSSPAAGLFDTLGEVTNRSTATLQGEGEARQSEMTRVTAHWLDIAATGPGVAPRGVRRYLWRETGEAVAPDARFYDLTSSLRMAFLPGAFTDVTLGIFALERVRAALEAAEEGDDETLDALAVSQRDIDIAALQSLQSRPDLGTEVRLGPSVTAVSVRVTADEQRLVSDLAIEDRFVLGSDGSGIDVDIEASAELGVWASLTEKLILPAIARASQWEETEFSSSAERLLELPDWQIVAREDTALAVGAAGDVFDIDPHTGLAIARDSIGRGAGDLSEETILLLNLSLNLYKAVLGRYKCESGPPETYANCMKCFRTGAAIGTIAAFAGANFYIVPMLMAGDATREVFC